MYLKTVVVPTLLPFNNNYNYKLVNYTLVFHAGVKGVESDKYIYIYFFFLGGGGGGGRQK